MNLAEIETFLTIVNTKSITRTADLLFFPSLLSATGSHLWRTNWVFPCDPSERPQAGGTDCQGTDFIILAERWMSL